RPEGTRGRTPAWPSALPFPVVVLGGVSVARHHARPGRATAPRDRVNLATGGILYQAGPRPGVSARAQRNPPVVGVRRRQHLAERQARLVASASVVLGLPTVWRPHC